MELFSNAQWVIIDAIIFMIMIIPFLFSIKYRNSRGLYLQVPKTHGIIPLYWILILIFCIYDKCGGDYFHYQEQVHNLYIYTGLGTGLEPVYVWLVSHIGYSYFVFRLVVWGSALLCLRLLLRYLKFTDMEAVWIFLLVLLVNFSYARVSLALAIFFNGYIRFCDPKKGRDKLLGIILLLASCFFHKTMIILLMLSCFSWVKLNKYLIGFLLVLFPMIVFVMNRYVGDLVLMLEAGSASAHYLNQDAQAQGMAAKLQDFLRFAPIVVFLFLLAKEYFNKEQRDKLPKYIKRLFVLVLVILYASTALSFLNVGSSAISYRIRNMCLLPMTIILIYHIKNRPLTRLTTGCYLTLFLSNIYYFMYMYYLKQLGLGV